MGLGNALTAKAPDGPGATAGAYAACACRGRPAACGVPLAAPGPVKNAGTRRAWNLASMPRR